MTDRLTIRRPDDWHVHLRDGAMLGHVAPYTARQFARAIVMPNLSPPVTTAAEGRAYRDRINAAVPAGLDFTPLIVAYLTDHSDRRRNGTRPCRGGVHRGKTLPCARHDRQRTASPTWRTSWACSSGCRRSACRSSSMARSPIHDVDIFDREAVFIERTLEPLVRALPALKIVFEHITTAEAAAFVADAPANVAATITPQHLHINRNAMLVGGIRPHAYCLPVAKREHHRLAVRKAAISGSPKFFLGTDSAPHAVHTKEASCGCAGIFNAPYALESYIKRVRRGRRTRQVRGFRQRTRAELSVACRSMKAP